MLSHEAVPALLRPALDREVEAFLLGRPVEEARQARRHLRLEGDRLRMDVAALRGLSLRSLAVRGEGEEGEGAVLALPEQGDLLIGAVRSRLPSGGEADPGAAQHRLEAARAMHDARRARAGRL